LAVQETEKVASLSKCPRSLYVLWQEFELGLGLGGRKPAKDFLLDTNEVDETSIHISEETYFGKEWLRW